MEGHGTLSRPHQPILMKLSQLAKQYENFAYLTFTFTIDGTTIYPSDHYQIANFEIELTSGLEANSMHLVITSIRNQTTLLQVLQTGAKVILNVGYQGKETLVFQGYLHTLELIQNISGYLQEVVLYAQDVKGLMMLRKQCTSSLGKKKSSILSELLHYSLYQSYVKKVVGTTIKKSLDTTCWINGKSDYDVVCDVCETTFSTFFVCKDTLYVQPKWEASRISVEFDEASFLTSLTQKTTLEDQCGTIIIQACDDMKTKKQMTAKVSYQGLPQAKNMSAISSKTQVMFIDQGFHQQEELREVAEAMKAEITCTYAMILGECVLLPELDCGSLIQFKTLLLQKNTKAYVTKIIHHYGEDGIFTSFEANIKG